MKTGKRLIEIPEDGIVRIHLMRGEDAVGERRVDLSFIPTVDAVEVPCKIGDFVWAIRNYKGKKYPQRGIVSDMYFLKDMSLQIVVKYVARGKWGETVFATDKEAYAAIGERKGDD